MSQAAHTPPTRLFPARLWRRVNEQFRTNGQFYVEAPRPLRYRRKARLVYRHFPTDLGVLEQAAYLVKNLVNIQRFPDANKRTSSILLEVFLRSNGYQLTCGDREYVEFLLRVQRGVPPSWWDGRSFSLKRQHIPWADDEYHGFLVDWLRANTQAL
jgi:prophage maintenance system killer protein